MTFREQVQKIGQRAKWTSGAGFESFGTLDIEHDELVIICDIPEGEKIYLSTLRGNETFQWVFPESKKCEKCGRDLPTDTSPSVYGCTAGSGCADYSKA